MAEFSLQRMRFADDGSSQEEFPLRALPTGRTVRSPLDPEFEQPEPWVLGHDTDAYGDPLP